jgi:integrase
LAQNFLWRAGTTTQDKQREHNMNLTDRGIERLIAKGVTGDHRDGGDLYARVGAKRIATWYLGYRFDGKRQSIKLGSFPDLGCHAARDRADDIRKAVSLGVDPKQTFDFNRLASRDGELGPESPFGDVVRAYHETIKGTFKSDKYRASWLAQLKQFTDPDGVGGKPMCYVNSNDIRDVLAPIWEARHVTAKKLAQRIEAVFIWAAGGGIVDQSALTTMKMVRARLPRVKHKERHHTSVPYADLPEFMSRLVERDAITALCLQWIILTQTRSVESRGMLWDEVDFDAGTWTIPGERIKTIKKDEHVVFLCDAQIEFLRRMLAMNLGGDLVFPSERGKALSVNAFRALYERMGDVDGDGKVTISTHGFRATFRAFAERMTDHPTRLIEEMLGHSADAVEEAYRRGARREHVMRAMAQTYADYAFGLVSLDELESALAA